MALVSFADMNGVIVSGSSIGTGSHGQPSITTTGSQFGHITFGYENGKGGPKATLIGSTPSFFNKTSMTTWQNLIEDNLSNVTDTASVEGETPLSGFCNGLSELMLRERGITLDPMIGSVCAIPGTGFPSPTYVPIDRYQNMKDHVLQQKLIANNQGKSYSLQFIIMALGAEEPTMDDATFQATVENTVDDFSSWVMSTTNQAVSPQWLFTTAAYPSSYSLGGHPQAIFNVCLEKDNCWIGTPEYAFSISPTDPPHHTAIGYKLIGVNMVPAAKSLLLGITPKMTYPIEAVLQGNTVFIRFNKRVFPIVLDSVSLNVTDCGFRVRSDVGTCTLGTPSVGLDGLTVQLPIVSTVPTANQNPRVDTISYTGLTNIQGCSLHDSDKRTITFSGVTYNLWSWCVPFDIPITVINS